MRALELRTSRLRGTVRGPGDAEHRRGRIEAFVKPYLATHGGIPANTPHAGALAELSDYLAFIALFTIGLAVVRPSVDAPAPLPAPA
jgi:hypothetical protein